MLEVIEGKAPLPRWFPPYVHGLFAAEPQAGWEASSHGGQLRTTGQPNPTLVNNIETLANVGHILDRGADWFRSMGTAESPGTIVATVVGDVVAPDVGEVEMGTPLGDVIDAVGSGVRPGRSVKAVFSGVANPVLSADALLTPVSYEGFAAAGSGMGSAGFIVYDDTACMVDAAARLSRFLAVESCGQCLPCKLGSGAITEHLERIQGGAGEESDVVAIHQWLERVTDGARCYLATEERDLVASVLQAFPQEFVDHIEHRQCPQVEQRPMPKLLDLEGGSATYDESYWRKRPDWTYDPAPEV